MEAAGNLFRYATYGTATPTDYKAPNAKANIPICKFIHGEKENPVGCKCPKFNEDGRRVGFGDITTLERAFCDEQGKNHRRDKQTAVSKWRERAQGIVTALWITA